MIEQERQALVTSLRLLAASPKSRKLLEQKLLDKGFEPAAVSAALKRLEGQGFLNDRLFAQTVFESLLGRRVSGRKRVAFELKKRGVPAALIQELLEGYSPDEEREKAFELAQDRYRRWERLERVKRQKKIYDFLIRRGFDFSIAKGVVDAVEREAKRT